MAARHGYRAAPRGARGRGSTSMLAGEATTISASPLNAWMRPVTRTMRPVEWNDHAERDRLRKRVNKPILDVIKAVPKEGA